MATRQVKCRQCMFKGIGGNKEPCINCDEIVVVRDDCKYKFKNNFKPMNSNELLLIEEIKKRLEEKLIELAQSKPILSTYFNFLEGHNVVLTGFVSDVDCANVTIYQLAISENKEINIRSILLGNNMLVGFNKAYRNYERVCKDLNNI